MSDYTTNIEGTPGTTVAFTASDNTASSLTDMSVGIVDADDNEAIGVLITVETQSARIAFTASPSATLGHVVTAGSTFKIWGPKAVKLLKMRNAADGSNFKAIVTPFFAN